MLVERGVERIAAEELTVPPGGDELFSLLRLKRHVEEGAWDVIVVDCAPTGETLRLLSFPEAARWWLGKLLGRETQLLAAARPLARAFLDLRLPDEDVVGEVHELVGNLVAMHDILRDRDARLGAAGDDARPDGRRRGDAHVHLPEPLRVPDRRRDREPRLPRRSSTGTYFGAWRDVQQRELERVREGFAPGAGAVRAVLREPRCWARRCSTASARRCSTAPTPAALLHAGLAQEFSLDGGQGEVRLAVPFAGKGDVSLKKVGDELVVRVDGRKRTVVLPPALAALKPAGAALDDGALVVRFA